MSIYDEDLLHKHSFFAALWVGVAVGLVKPAMFASATDLNFSSDCRSDLLSSALDVRQVNVRHVNPFSKELKKASIRKVGICIFELLEKR